MFEGGTGCHMWDAGFLLAEFVLNNPHIFAGQGLSRAWYCHVCCSCVHVFEPLPSCSLADQLMSSLLLVAEASLLPAVNLCHT
jgi:hypothetical protein